MQRECNGNATGSNGKQHEGTRSDGEQWKSCSIITSINKESPTQGKGTHDATRRSTLRAPTAQRREQHRHAGTRSFASHARTSETERFPGWTHTPKLWYVTYIHVSNKKSADPAGVWGRFSRINFLFLPLYVLFMYLLIPLSFALYSVACSLGFLSEFTFQRYIIVVSLSKGSAFATQGGGNRERGGCKEHKRYYLIDIRFPFRKLHTL